MEKSDGYKKQSGSGKKWDGGGPGGGPYGGGGGQRGPPRGLDNVRGIDHSMLFTFFNFFFLWHDLFINSDIIDIIFLSVDSLPACGSCCGG